MTPEEINALFVVSITGNYDDEASCDAVSKLRLNGNKYIFSKAAEWCRSPDSRRRARGAAVLCQLRSPELTDQELAKPTAPIFVEESFAVIADIIQHETEEDALGSEIAALGHLGKEEAIPLLIGYENHESEEIRFDLACALGHFCNSLAAIECLMVLADDADGDVRNWSLFGLGTLSDQDFPALRDVLAAHLTDLHDDARQEAIAGLAKRKDERSVLPLLNLLLSGSYFSHHEYDFKSLVDAPDEADWGTDDFIDALYQRFPEFLPKRDSRVE